MSIACKKCGGRNTQVVAAKDLAKATNNPNVMTASAGSIDPKVVVEIISLVVQGLVAVFGWLKASEKNKNNSNVVLCKDCGAWEKV